MKIAIETSDLIKNVKSKSHNEVSQIEDEKLRYKIEAGTEKEAEIRTCIAEAVATFEASSFRFIKPIHSEEVMASLGLPEILEFEFMGGGRRLHGKAPALASLVLSLLTNLTLAKFYTTVNAADLSKSHDELTNGDTVLLEKLLFEKRPPLI